MKEPMKKLDVSQIIRTSDDRPVTSPEGKQITLQHALGIVLNEDHTDLPIIEQAQVYKSAIRVALAEGSAMFSQAEYDVIKKSVDKQRPSNNPFINQSFVCVQLRDMVNAAETVEDIQATNSDNRLVEQFAR